MNHYEWLNPEPPNLRAVQDCDDDRGASECCECGELLTADDPAPLAGNDPRCYTCEKEARIEWKAGGDLEPGEELLP